MLTRVFARAQPPMPLRRILVASAGVTLTIAVLGLLADGPGLPVLIAAFGSSCVLVFTFPDAPLAQPSNVIGGHLLASAIGVGARFVLPPAWWSIALTVGVVTAVMAAVRLTHPPAGGSPIAIMLAGEDWTYLLVPVLLGAVIVCAFALAWRRMFRGVPMTSDGGEG